MTSIVGVRQIYKSFGPIAALKDISLDIGPGEIRGICGENGAGKSTLVKILTGVYRPDQGNVGADRWRASEPHHAAASPGTRPCHCRARTEPLSGFVGRGQHLARLASRSVPAQAPRAVAAGVPLETLALLGASRIEFRRPGRALHRSAPADRDRASAGTRGAGAHSRRADRHAVGCRHRTHSRHPRGLRAQGRSIIYITHRLGEVFELCDQSRSCAMAHVATQPVSEHHS